MSPDLFREVGEALYGPRWQSDLSRDLDVADRTVRRWSAGDFQSPESVWAELRKIIRAREASLAEVRRKLST